VGCRSPAIERVPSPAGWRRAGPLEIWGCASGTLSSHVSPSTIPPPGPSAAERTSKRATARDKCNAPTQLGIGAAPRLGRPSTVVLRAQHNGGDVRGEVLLAAAHVKADTHLCQKRSGAV
ncbi:uncharacterized protein PHACADRAFT_167896, partial [Phanerochaete carnosa HHB-10118-sp]